MRSRSEGYYEFIFCYFISWESTELILVAYPMWKKGIKFLSEIQIQPVWFIKFSTNLIHSAYFKYIGKWHFSSYESSADDWDVRAVASFDVKVVHIMYVVSKEKGERTVTRWADEFNKFWSPISIGGFPIELFRNKNKQAYYIQLNYFYIKNNKAICNRIAYFGFNIDRKSTS